MNTEKLRRLFFIALIAGNVLSCTDEIIEPEPDAKDDPTENTDPETPVDKGDAEPLEIIDGNARFYLSESENSLRAAYGVGITDWSALTATVGTKTYPINISEDGRAYIDVTPSSSNTYNAVLTGGGSDAYLGASNYVGLHHPYSLAVHTAKDVISALPLYASYSEKTGNKLIFSMACSLLELNVKGDAKLTSVKAENPAKEYMAGTGNYLASKGLFSITSGVPFVALNCTNMGSGTALSDGGTKILLPIASGAYTEGIVLTLSDSEHKSVTVKVDAFEIAPDATKTIDINYSPDDDLLYSEHFDNFVWGGDIMGGSSTFAFAPEEDAATTESGTKLLGYEPALYATSYDKAGTGFIQSEIWSEVSGKTVEASHKMSASYIRSRNIGDYRLLYRCQEHQGYISVGAGNAYRGMFEPEIIPGIANLSDIKVSFDYCPKVGFNDKFSIELINGGKITSCTIDGAEAVLDKELSGYEGITSNCVFAQSAVQNPSSTSGAKTWHHVECYVENVNDASRIRLATVSAESGTHGFYLDNFELRYVKSRDKNAVSGLRVLFWNIQNGMWADQDNNYDNFVAWIKKYEPDVCVFCEGETIFNTAGVRIHGTDRTLPREWSSVAARFGHDYMAKGADKDNYPQIITSKYPISTIKEIYDTDTDGNPISHGAGLFKISHLARPVYFLTLHLWPQAYSYEYQSLTTAEQQASASAKGGDYYRQFEIKYLCDNYINGTAYSAQEDWLMMGDFNAKSSVDNFYYGYSSSDTAFLVHDYISDNTDMLDIIAERNPGDFFSSVQTDNQRIDFMYASPSMYEDIANATILIDSWTTLVRDNSVTSGYFCRPSDHRPILVDFKLK